MEYLVTIKNNDIYYKTTFDICSSKESIIEELAREIIEFAIQKGLSTFYLSLIRSGSSILVGKELINNSFSTDTSLEYLVNAINNNLAEKENQYIYDVIKEI